MPGSASEEYEVRVWALEGISQLEHVLPQARTVILHAYVNGYAVCTAPSTRMRTVALCYYPVPSFKKYKDTVIGY